MSENGEHSEHAGMNCFADDRDAFNDYAKYFNNQHLSDICLKIGDDKYAAHKIVLCRSSEVFDKILADYWQDSNELKLTEDPECERVFSFFLRFLYCNNIVLNDQNTLPLLILADKYSVHGLQRVCTDYASKYLLPVASLKTLIHVWLKYSTTAYHRDLTRECVQRISKHFWHIISDEEWAEDFLSLDRDQLTELLKSNELIIPNEFVLFEAITRWFNSEKHSQRRGQATLIQQILPLIRFPYMTADELIDVENSELAQDYKNTIMPLTHLAFKYIKFKYELLTGPTRGGECYVNRNEKYLSGVYRSMTLTSRSKLSEEFNGLQFICRNYTDISWYKRLAIPSEQLLSLKPPEQKILNVATRSSTFPLSTWDWELIFQMPPSYSSINSRSPGELVIELKSVDLDQQRSIEYSLSVVDDRQILRTFSGRKTFTKSRTTETLQLEDRLPMSELLNGDRSLIHNGDLNLQLLIRPIV